jgi:hypothetical protein
LFQELLVESTQLFFNWHLVDFDSSIRVFLDAHLYLGVGLAGTAPV